MSSPSEAHSEKSVTVSSPLATDATIEDTASSAQGMGPPPGVVVTVLTDAPNTSYARRMRDVRARSAWPRPRRTFSPSKLSVAQRRAQIAEAKAESAFSGVGDVAEQARHARSVVEAAIAKAQSVRGEVSSRMAKVAQRSDVSVSNVADALTGRVQQVAAHFEAHTSHAVGQVAQQLEKEVQAVATSTAATAEKTTRAAMDDIRRDFQAQFEQTRAESQ